MLRGVVLLAATSSAHPAGAQGDCQLGPFREHIDATLASMTIDHEEAGAAADSRGQPFTMIDVGFSGAVDGCVTKRGPLQMMTGESQPRPRWPVRSGARSGGLREANRGAASRRL